MNSKVKAHRGRDWRVHTLAPDFSLLDVSQFNLGDRSAELADFLACLWGTGSVLANSWLGTARVHIGRAMGWDAREFTLAIPGCRETRVAERLSASDRSSNRASADAPSPLQTPTLKTVYQFAEDALFEVSNDTIHALLHVALIRAASGNLSATLAVYVKSRGLFSQLYMAAINPFRYAIVYPTLIRQVEEAWQGASPTLDGE